MNLPTLSELLTFESYIKYLVVTAQNGSLHGVLYSLGIFGTTLLLTFLLQAEFNQLRKQAAELNDANTSNAIGALPLFWLELRYFPFVAYIFLPLHYIILGIKSLFKFLTTDKESTQAQAKVASYPWLAATLGPTFLMGAIVALSFFLLGELSKFVIRPGVQARREAAGLDAAIDTEHAITYWLFENFQDKSLADQFVQSTDAMLVFSALIWLVLWWSLSLLIRIGYYRDLSRLSPEHVLTTIPRLGLWRRLFGNSNLISSDDSFSLWAKFAAIALVLTSLGAAFFVDQRVWHLEAPPFCLILIVTCGWLANLLLEGEKSQLEIATVETTSSQQSMPGWRDVEELLRVEGGLQLLPPVTAGTVPVRQGQAGTFQRGGALSPLIGDDPASFGAKSGFNHLRPSLAQLTVLRTLLRDDDLIDDGSRPLSEHTRASSVDTGLNLVSSARSELPIRRPTLHVAASEGAGKSTLARLAAVNHVLKKGLRVLVISSTEEAANDAYREIDASIRTSPLRWSVLYERAETSSLKGVPSGTPPHIVVTTLEWIAETLLPKQGEHRNFLETLDLIIVDDAQHYIGARSEHAGLIFGRLNLALSRTEASLGGKRLPAIVVFDNDGSEKALQITRQLTQRDLKGVHCATEDWMRTADASTQLPDGERRVYHLHDFVDQRDRRLSVREIIEACNRAGVPWHFRIAGDDIDQQGSLPISGVSTLHRSDALNASVIFLHGRQTHVASSLRTLQFAGGSYLAAQSDATRRQVVFIQITDNHERMAFDIRAQQGTLARLFKQLPIPMVRPPAAEHVEAHLSAELEQNPLEVAQVRDIFGVEPMLRLRDLARAERVQLQQQNELDPSGSKFTTFVYVRAGKRAFQNEKTNEFEVSVDGKKVPLLIPPLTKITRFVRKPVRIFDPQSQKTILEVDALNAALRYFPGATFSEDAQRWVVDTPTLSRAKTTSEILVSAAPADDLLSIPERVLSWSVPKESSLVWRKEHFGDQALLISTLDVQIRGEHLGTRYIDPMTDGFRRKLVTPEELRSAAYGKLPETKALVVHLGGLLGEDSSFNESVYRLISAAARMCVGLLFPENDPSIDAAVMRRDDASASQKSEGVLESGPHLLFFDTKLGGSGVIEALQTDGLEWVFRLMRLVLERVIHHNTLLMRYCDRELSNQSEKPTIKMRAQEADLRKHVLAWLDARFAPEDGGNALPSGANYPNGQEASDTPGVLGRAWVASTLGVTDLRWTRLHWRAPLTHEGRAADFGISHELIRELIENQVRVLREERFAGRALLPVVTSATLSGEAESLPGSEVPPADQMSKEQLAALTPPVGKLHGFDSSAIQDRLSSSKNPEVEPDPLVLADLATIKQALLDVLEEQLPVIESLGALLRNWLQNNRIEDVTQVVAEFAQLSAGLLGPAPEGDRIPVTKHDATDTEAESTEPQSEFRIHGPALVLHHGAANHASAALLLAALMLQRGYPAGIFVRPNGNSYDTLAALYVGRANPSLPHEVPTELQEWRASILAVPGASELSIERLSKRPAISVDSDAARMVAINLANPRQLTQIRLEELDYWYYLSLEGI